MCDYDKIKTCLHCANLRTIARLLCATRMHSLSSDRTKNVKRNAFIAAVIVVAAYFGDFVTERL